MLHRCTVGASRARILWVNLSAQSSHARERWLTRLFNSCSQLRDRSRERNMSSQGSWPLAHSSESVRKRPQILIKHDAGRLILYCKRRREVLNKIFLLANIFFRILLVCCGLAVKMTNWPCTSFLPGWGGEELGESESLIKFINRVEV